MRGKQILQKVSNPVVCHAEEGGMLRLGINIDGLLDWRDAARLGRTILHETQKAKRAEALARELSDPERDLAKAKENA